MQLSGEMGRFERPFLLALTSMGLCARTWCSLGMRCVPGPRSQRCTGTAGRSGILGFLHAPSPVYRISWKRGNYPACWGEQPENPGAKPPFFPWTSILTCCCPFIHIPLPSTVAFFPIFSSFCVVHWQRPRCCGVLDKSIAGFCWLST